MASSRHLKKYLAKEQIDCFLLVVNTKGTNVWCAAVEGIFTTDAVLAHLKVYNASELVDHTRLILPQLSVAGIKRKDLNAMTTDTSNSAKPIITSICPTCGCSLIRLGIGEDRWTTSNFEGKEYFFCCQGCTDLFVQEPSRYLEETKGLVVCPTCLAEKPVQWTVRMEIAGWEVFFCRCPYCPDVFRKDPDHYVKRLQGEIPYEGVFGQAGCCSTDTLETAE